MAQTALQDAPWVEVDAHHFVEIVAGANLYTLKGVVPVDTIRPGARIVTRSGAMRIEAVGVSVQRRVDLVRISALALGHDRPDDDILVPSCQPILVRDWRARAMFGTEQAIVPAGSLVDGRHICLEPEAVVRMVRLVLPRAAVLYASWLEVAAFPGTVSA